MDKLAAILLVASVAVTCSNAIEGKSTLEKKPLLSVLKAAGTTSKLQERQTCELDYPLVCNNTLAQLDTLIYQAETGNPADISTSTVTTLLDQLCTSECLAPILQYLNCMGEVLLAEFYNNGFCGESDGTYCFVVWLNGYSDGIDLVDITCGTDNSCVGNCQQTLQDTVNYLGCCAASLYGNTGTNLFSELIAPSQFSTCDVSLGEQCEGAEDSAVANAVHLGLLVVFATAALLAML